jgi:hypothetical protein
MSANYEGSTLNLQDVSQSHKHQRSCLSLHKDKKVIEHQNSSKYRLTDFIMIKLQNSGVPQTN